jgi:hypothetical protein
LLDEKVAAAKSEV